MFLLEELNRKIQNSVLRFVFSRKAFVLTKSLQQLAIEKRSITLRSDVPFCELKGLKWLSYIFI